MRILFVCLANLCRSPLAEVIARTRHGDEVEAWSAGVAPASGPPFPEAVDVVRRFYGADISGHRPRHVLAYDLDSFDHIVALDTSVYFKLAALKAVPRERLHGWEVADPCGLGVSAYEAVARRIEDDLEKFLEDRRAERIPGRRNP
jgi:protein-tyrosine-phosphatase